MTDAAPVREHAFGDNRPFTSCHASTLLELDNGETLIAYFAGAHEKNPDVAVWLSRRTADRWQPPVKVADFPHIAHWNPALFQAPSGVLWLFYKVGRTIPAWQTYVTTSEDAGHTWSPPRELVPGDTTGGRGPVKNKPILLSDGTWISGASHEGEAGWRVFVDRSEDGGRTWRRSRYLPLRDGGEPERGAIQPTLWESAPGQVHMLTRSNFGAILRADSDDSGRTWSPLYPSGLPNNNSGIDLARLADGTLVLACTPVWAGPGRPQPRTPLVLLTSSDNGVTWQTGEVLEDEPGEYSYPAVVATGEAVSVSYTWRRERIAYRRGPLPVERLPSDA